MREGREGGADYRGHSPSPKQGVLTTQKMQEGKCPVYSRKGGAGGHGVHLNCASARGGHSSAAHTGNILLIYRRARSQYLLPWLFGFIILDLNGPWRQGRASD